MASSTRIGSNGGGNGFGGDLPHFKGIDFHEMAPHLTDAYVVKNLIGSQSLVGIIGPSGSGKTFFAADLAMHIAAGVPWRGHRMRGGLVIYVALEGAISAEHRFLAGRKAGFPGKLRLRLVSEPVNLRDPLSVAALVAFIQETETFFGEPCIALFIDTLARAMAGGDENSSEDMGELIRGADYLRTTCRVAVILVHHMGKDESRGARGHSSLKAALDTEIAIADEIEMRVAQVMKQRDYTSGMRYGFTLEQVEIGQDEDFEAVHSCVVRACDAQEPLRKQRLGKHQARLLLALQTWLAAHQTDLISIPDLTALAKHIGMDRRRLSDVKFSLQSTNHLAPCVGGFRVFLDA